jgi:excisionase family DNA binding protein
MPARKFLTLEEAAKMLGVSPDALTEMRDRHKISAYRDGASWKFKSDDVERLIAERKSSDDDAAAEYAEIEDDSILLSELELGQSGPGTSSTVIGKSSDVASAESDIRIAAPKTQGAARASEPEIALPVDDDLVLPSDSGILSTSPSTSPGSGSSGVLSGGSGVLASGSGLSAKFDELDTLDLDLPSPAESGITPIPPSGSSSSKLFSASPAPPAADDHDEILLASEVAEDPAGGSDISLVSPSDDDELVLGGIDSDITHSAGDSGISLLDPQDSGLSLMDAPLDLGGSKVESLELGDDDMMLLDESKATGSQADSEDDFLLTPLEEGGDEADSGSQVIALDTDDVQFDEAGGSLLDEAAPAGASMLEEDLGQGSLAAPGFAATAAPVGAYASAASDAAFGTWNVVSLCLVVLFLCLSGMMMFDLMRNMWSWNGAYAVNSSLMDMVLSWFG